MAVLRESETKLTEAENRLVNELVRQLREVIPPNGGLWARWSPLVIGAVLALFGATLNSNLSAARDEQNAANARIESIDARSVANLNAIDRLDRGAATLDQWRRGADEELRAYGVAVSEFRQLQGVTAEIDRKLDGLREERLGDTARVVEAMNIQRTETALLRQELQQLRHALGRGRQPSRQGDGTVPRAPFTPASPATPEPAATSGDFARR